MSVLGWFWSFSDFTTNGRNGALAASKQTVRIRPKADFVTSIFDRLVIAASDRSSFRPLRL